MKYSQFDEETHLWAILDIIGDGSKVCTDIGARLQYSNVARLIEERGYTGYLIDASEDACKDLREKFPDQTVSCTVVDITNVNKIVHPHTHVLNIDIDSHDWWVWANLIVKPAVVMIETTPNPGMQLAEYGAGRKSPKGYGCSLEAAKALGAMKGYTYLGRTKVNAFFTNRECSYRFDTAGHAGKHTGTENSVL